MAVELLEQVPGLDAILVPVSGGGMLAGICVAAKAIKPNIKSKLIIYTASKVKHHLYLC